MKGMSAIAMVLPVLLIFLAQSAYALPSNWYGLVSINGNNVSSTNVTVYNSTGSQLARGWDVVPEGQYYLRVNDTTGAPFVVYFRVGGMLANEGNQLCGDGNSTKLELTVTDSDDDDSSVLEDCNDTDPDAWKNWSVYADTDGDGFGTGNITTICAGDTLPVNYSLNNSDCNDTDAAVNPNATELCNGMDDDCDGTVDMNPTNTSENLTQSCGTSNVGECRLGTRTCSAGAWGGCSGSVEPASETCDGKDNDCDGTVDNGVCGGAPPAGGGGPSGGGGCSPSWNCTDWSDCQPGGTQSRTCTDRYNCGTTSGRPALTQSCTYVPPVPAPSPGGNETLPEQNLTPELPPENQTGGANPTGTGILGFLTAGEATGYGLLLLAAIIVIYVAYRKLRKKK